MTATDTAAAPPSPTVPGRVFGLVPPRSEERELGPTRAIRVAAGLMLRERRRLLVSMIIVALGVAYLAGSLSILNRVSGGLDQLAGVGSERGDMVLQGRVAIDTPLERTRQLVPSALASLLKAVPGVTATQSRIQDSAILLDKQLKPIVPLGLAEQPIGANWPTEASLNPYTIVGKGRGPTAANEIAVDTTSARVGNLAVGDSIIVATKADQSTYTIVGIVRFGSRDLPEGSSLALFETATARRIFTRAGDDNSIAIKLDPRAERDKVVSQLRGVIPMPVDLVDGKTFEEDRAEGLSKSFVLIRMLLLGFAGLAIIVGAFTVANSNSLLFARRRHVFALLRLNGASPPQLVGAATVEAICVGLAALLLGIPAGLVVGAGLERALRGIGTAIPLVGPPLSWSVVGWCALVGVLVTVATAILPALDAARVSPLQALHRNAEAASTNSALRLAIRVAVIVVVAGAIGLAAGGTDGLAIGAAVGIALGALSWLVPVALSVIVSWVTTVLLGRSRAIRSLTALRSRQARGRAAATAGALMMATFVVASLSTLSSSFVSSINQQISGLVEADYVIDSGTFTTGGLPASLVESARKLDGVTAVSGWRIGAAQFNNQTVRLAGFDGPAVLKVLNLRLEGNPDELRANEVLLSAEAARSSGLQVGDSANLVFENNVQTLKVVGIYPSTSILLGSAIIDRTLLSQLTPASNDIAALVKVAKASPRALQEVRRLASTYGVANVSTPSQLVDRRSQPLIGFEQVIQWMLLFSVGLAVIGVANTLYLSVNERKRELGLLRALGGGRDQVTRVVMVEATALSLTGTVLGASFGVGVAWAAVRVLAKFGLDVFTVPLPIIVAILLGAFTFGILGAWLPARAAASTGIAEAIAETDDISASGASRRRRARYRNRPGSPTLSQEPRHVALTQAPPSIPEEPRTNQPTISSPPTAPQAPTDIPMARCYNCGHETGSAIQCPACGVQLEPDPLGMFSTDPTPEPESLPDPSVTEEVASRWSTGDKESVAAAANAEEPVQPEFVEAAVIDESARYHERPPTPQPAPNPTYTYAAPPPPSGPPPAQTYAAPGPTYVAPTYGAPQPPPYQPPPSPQYPSAPYPPYSPPATPMGPTGSAEFGSPPGALVPVHLPSGDINQMGQAVARMCPEAQERAIPALLVAGVLLGPEERVIGTVFGWNQSMPTVAVLSSGRVLIISERRWKPVIDTFPLRPSLTVYGRHLDGRATMTFQDADHVITLEQIPDVALAVEMATATRTHSTHRAF